MNVFFIDADNLNSADWIDEAFRVLQETVGSLSVRRAYGSADSLKALSESLQKWAVRPFVNLPLTKNTTDMALAVDAMALACQTPAPRLMVIGSGDADYAPLVVRLRELGIGVICVSERGKMAREAVPAYGRVILVGQATQSADAAAQATEVRAVRKSPRKAAVKTPRTSQVSPEKVQSTRASTRKTASRKTAQNTTAPGPEAPQEAAISAPGADKPERLAVQVSANQAPVLNVAAILAVVPGLQAGQTLPINVVTKALRDAQLLGKKAASPRLLRNFPDDFELVPAENPNSVRYILPSQVS